VIAKGRVGPGQILVVDTQTGELLRTEDVDQRLKSAHPYRKWLRDQAIRLENDEVLDKKNLGLKWMLLSLKLIKKCFW
jgi:hypothetical protein